MEDLKEAIEEVVFAWELFNNDIFFDHQVGKNHDPVKYNLFMERMNIFLTDLALKEFVKFPNSIKEFMRACEDEKIKHLQEIFSELEKEISEKEKEVAEELF